MTPRPLLVLPVLLAALTACSGSDGSPEPSPPVSASPSPSVQPSLSPSLLAPASPSPAASPVASASPSVIALPFCRTSQLRLSIGGSEGAAGTQYQPLVLTNQGGTCTLHGYPGVSFLDSSGRQIGSPAEMRRAATPRVVLRPGGRAIATLSIATAANYADSVCRPQQAARVRVYPPGQRAALTAADPVAVCAAPGTGQLHIEPVQRG